LSCGFCLGVFSVGFVYVFFRGGRLLHRREVHVCRPGRIWGLLSALGAGSGVSLVTFRNELRVFYLLNFTPTFVGADCAAVVAVGQSLGVYISPERRFSFSLAAPPFALAFLGATCWTPGGVGCGARRL
jgi:hypothetical protein